MRRWAKSSRGSSAGTWCWNMRSERRRWLRDGAGTSSVCWAIFNNVIVAIKVAVLLIFLGIGGHYLLLHRELLAMNWHPFIPPNEGFGQYGISGVLRAAGIIFFAYIGFDAVSTAAQEARNP